MFTFTENDLPPGPLATRLLAAKVSVVLTHARPGAPSPGPGPHQIHAVDWEGMELGGDGGGRDTAADSSALALIGPVEHSVTPETDPEEASDESAYGNAIASRDGNSNSNSHGDSDSDALTISGGGGAYKYPAQGSAGDSSDDDEGDVEDDGRFYLSSDDDSPMGTPARRRGNGALQVTGGLEPLRVVVSPSPWNVLGTPGNFASGGGGGFTTPLSTRCPSPLRSCPRSAISSKRERLNERTDVMKEKESTATVVVPSGVPRWASAKTFGAAPERKKDLSPMDTVGGSETQQGRRPRAAKPLGSLEGNSLTLPTERAVGAGAGGRGARKVNGVRLSRKPWAATAAAAPGAADTNGGPWARLDKLALQGYAEENGSTSGSLSRGGTEEGEGLVSTKTVEVYVPSSHSTTSSGFKRPSPAVKILLDAAAARSFEDLQSSKHTSAFGSEVDKSENGGANLDLGMVNMDAFLDVDEGGHTPHASAGWANGETRPTSSAAAVPGETENRLTVTKGASTSSLEIVQSEGLETVQPLKERVWPPPRGVVAGVEEVQGALESPNGRDGEQQQEVSRHTRRHGSTGMAWGEDAKLALARKRLQWEK